VDGELKDVANGNIIEPQQRNNYTVDMDPGVFKVFVARVLLGYEDLDPPYQPQEADSQMVLEQCKNWTLLWPKIQIRLGDDTTPQKTSFGPTPPSPLKPTMQVQPFFLCHSMPEVGGPSDVLADRGKLTTTKRNDELDDFINNFADDGLLGLDVDLEEQHRHPDTRMADVEQDCFVP
jgi:hypothetical protein